MAQRDPSGATHIEEAREIIWDALQRLEEAQRILFRAGDLYVHQVWGDGVRAILDITDRITEVSGELSSIDIELRKMARRDTDRGPQPPRIPRMPQFPPPQP